MNNRVIKFRGLDVKGNWYIGNLSILTKNIGSVKAGMYISNSVGLPFAYEVRPETVGQFTGLLDKNGKEIYEGDIVTVAGKHPSKVSLPEDWQFYDEQGEERLEIIGNVFENPDLLK